MKKYLLLLIIITSTFFGSIYALENKSEGAIYNNYEKLKITSKQIITNNNNQEPNQEINKSKQPDFKLLLLLPVYLIGLILFRSRHHKFFVR